MRALQYHEIGQPPAIQMIDAPTAGPGQVLLRILAAGVCHSDQFVMSLPESEYSFGLPLTLGHECVGEVLQLGQGAAGVEIGDLVALYGPWGCGTCVPCVRGEENYCLHAARLGIKPPGMGAPGGMADLLLVDDPRHLVPLGGLDPVAAVCLTDAGLTPYHAIKNELDLLGPGSTAVVVGAGGLGHVAIQLLRALTSAKVVVVDISEEKLDLAREMGAHEVLLSGDSCGQRVLELTGGVGAEVVFDLVGNDATLDLARRVVRINGSIVIVGVGGGLLPTGFFATPYGVRVRAPLWGTRDELLEVFELARQGLVEVQVETHPLEAGPAVYERLRQGLVRGRAVLLPSLTP